MLTVEHFNGGVNRVYSAAGAEELPAEAVGQMRVGRMGGRRRWATSPQHRVTDHLCERDAVSQCGFMDETCSRRRLANAFRIGSVAPPSCHVRSMFVERKTVGDSLGDIARTVVAFANIVAKPRRGSVYRGH